MLFTKLGVRIGGLLGRLQERTCLSPEGVWPSCSQQTHVSRILSGAELLEMVPPTHPVLRSEPANPTAIISII